MPLNNAIATGPTHQNVVTGTRAVDTNYQNTTGKALFVGISCACLIANAGEFALILGKSDSSTPPADQVAQAGIFSSTATESVARHSIFFIVMPGNYYRGEISKSGPASVTLSIWTEWY